MTVSFSDKGVHIDWNEVTISFVTFVHPPHYARRLHEPGVLRSIVESHQYSFDDVVVIHQRCKAEDYPLIDYPCRTVDLSEEEFTPLLVRFGVNPDNPRGDELTHGPGAPHFWRYHIVNHLRGLEVTNSDYIVFADCDTYMKSQPPDRSWVEEGISILESYSQVLIVSPGDGGNMMEAKIPEARLTQNVSQQLFLCRGAQFRNDIDFDVAWDGQFDAPAGPMQEFYEMLEGRLWRYMRHRNMWRAILPDQWRYWHDSYWAQGSGVNA